MGDRRRSGDALSLRAQPIQAVLLDAGYTMVFPDPPVEYAYARVFARYGLAPTVESVHGAVKGTWREISARRARGEDSFAAGDTGFWHGFVEAVYQKLGGGDVPEGLLAELIEHFGSRSSWAIYPEVKDVLVELSRRGFRLAVVSNWDSSLPRLLASLALADHFETLVVSALVGAAKPSGGIFHEALRRLALPPESVVHVGDSIDDDYHGARAVGIHALLLDRDGRRPKETHHLRSLSDLLDHLGPSPAASPASP